MYIKVWRCAQRQQKRERALAYRVPRTLSAKSVMRHWSLESSLLFVPKLGLGFSLFVYFLNLFLSFWDRDLHCPSWAQIQYVTLDDLEFLISLIPFPEWWDCGVSHHSPNRCWESNLQLCACEARTLATHPHPESLLFSFQSGGTRLSSLIPRYAELKGLGPLNIRTVAAFEFTELLDYNQENKCMRYLADAEFEWKIRHE